MDSSWEPAIRLSCFSGVFLAMALWEIAAPRRRLSARKSWRWASNLGLVVINTVIVRLALPMGAVAMAVVATDRGWGLLNNVDLPPWAGVVVSVIALDLAIYLQHVMFHAVPILWRLHMVHHADLDFDVSTGFRFHTIEIVLSMGIKLAAIVLLGAPALGVLIFEVLLNATSMFNHGNVRLPRWIDGVLRLLVVTPEMHRVHHSTIAQETNSNFGFNMPWWDFLFGTYRSEPAAGHEGMTIGLRQFRDEHQVDRLPGMLALPFVGDPGNYPVNREAGEKLDRALSSASENEAERHELSGTR